VPEPFTPCDLDVFANQAADRFRRGTWTPAPRTLAA